MTDGWMNEEMDVEKRQNRQRRPGEADGDG